jgi:hypothetical protein
MTRALLTSSARMVSSPDRRFHIFKGQSQTENLETAMQSVIPAPTNVILINGDSLNPNFYPRDLVDGIVDRASWFALMEKVEEKKTLAVVLQACCFCCNLRQSVMQGVCTEINNYFYDQRPIYSWTKDDKLSVNAEMLQVDIAERAAASKKKRNSVISK